MNNPMPNDEFSKALAISIVGLLPYIVLAKFAHWSIIVTAILALISVFFTLPFHFMWGFSLVPIGGLVAIFLGKRAYASIQRTD